MPKTATRLDASAVNQLEESDWRIREERPEAKHIGTPSPGEMASKSEVLNHPTAPPPRVPTPGQRQHATPQQHPGGGLGDVLDTDVGDLRRKGDVEIARS